MFKILHNCTHFAWYQSNAQNFLSQASKVCESWTSRCSSWIQKRQRNQRSNWQHLLGHRKSKRVPEKHLLLLYWLHQSLCVHHWKAKWWGNVKFYKTTISISGRQETHHGIIGAAMQALGHCIRITGDACKKADGWSSTPNLVRMTISVSGAKVFIPLRSILGILCTLMLKNCRLNWKAIRLSRTLSLAPNSTWHFIRTSISRLLWRTKLL